MLLYMDNNEIKFTSDEFDEINQLNGEYQSLLLEFGELYLKKISLEQESEAIKTDDQELRSVYTDLKKREVALSSRIQKKYGEGTPDFARGVYIKLPNEEN